MSGDDRQNSPSISRQNRPSATLKEKLYYGKAVRSDITRITRRLGDEIGKVYGWDFPKPRQAVSVER